MSFVVDVVLFFYPRDMPGFCILQYMLFFLFLVLSRFGVLSDVVIGCSSCYDLQIIMVYFCPI